VAGSYRVRVVRGDFQFEAEGDKAFVLDMLKRFDPAAAAAAPAGAKSRSGRAAAPKGKVTAKGHSPSEFIRQLGLKKHSDIVLAFGYYLETELDKKEFSPADINNLYYEAKMENSNTSQACINNTRRGFMMEAKGTKKGGRKKYTVTRSGEEHVEKKLSGSAE
jgi:hypothetical protein